MRINIKKIIAGACCLAMMLSVGTIPVSSDDEEGTEVTESSEDEEIEPADEDYVPRTEDEAMADMTLVAENSNLALYKNEDEVTLALVDKSNGEIWWSNPINADGSAGKNAQIQELKAGMTLIYGEPSKRRTTTINSKVKGKAKIEDVTNGVKITYSFSSADITVPVTYTLEEDYLKLYVDTSEIVEEDSDKIVTDLSFMTTFGAATDEEEGYYVVPDGSGALINFNNGKTGLKVYSGKVYGSDITAVSQTAPAVTQQVYLPMYGIVKENSGLMVVADKGDTCATINAYVSGQNKTSYNTCYFDFEIRTSDEYLMGGDSNPLKVFEKRGILVPEIEVRYYPVSSTDNGSVDYIDIADKYRDYLTSSEYGVTKSETVDETALYVDFYGAVLKQESIVGLPITMQHVATSFDDAQDILSELQSGGVDNIVVNYNQWTTADIKEKVSDEAKPASKLGGKSDFNSLLSFAESNNISIYPAVDNLTFKTGNGYWTMTDTAIRVSNAYSKQYTYDLAYGIENQYYDAMSLLSPATYEKIFNSLAESYSSYGLTNISAGSASTVIYGDYGKKALSREMVKYDLQEYYQLLNDQVGSVLADGANAYILPYVDHITNVPLNSSKYDIFDMDIPFYQIVMHGLKSYSTTAVNGDAQIADLILNAVASGSNLRFDLVAEEANELKDTRYDVYYYAESVYWTEDAASCYSFVKEILSDVSNQKITEYNILSDDEIETVYENGTKTVVNMTDRTVTKNGTVYNLYDYIGKEVIG
ncbi:MAG: DUF5696 domain-containing protein [Oscillospiraceae bacterium]|nr:DUF5696 domain-containing protein [Oscillospiraceae bacterium]